jgi:formylglycine-generating enzyme required for sulfatase activity
MRTNEHAGLCAGLVLLTTLGAACGSQDKTSGMELTCTSGEACDDEDPCTEDDKCDPQGTCAGTPISCDDDRPCTNDSCGTDGQCVHELQAGFCLIDGVCRTDGESPDGEPCKECMTAASTSAWTSDDTNPCGQDDQCHTGAQCKTGVCVPGELSVDCNDNNPCTYDTCDPAAGCQNVPNTDPCEGGICTDGKCKCVPACEGKECGDDDCGGTCGQCGDLEVCSEEGQCTCLFAECEGVCCSETGVCSEGICCAPDCSGKECGDDGCGGTCWACGDLEACSEAGVCECLFADCAGICCLEDALCVEGACCTPYCGGKECGDDGCTGSCGQCEFLETCSEEGTCQCLFTDCAGICCDVGMVCMDGACCAPDCAGKLCGDDGCGGTCGECGTGECDAELHVCIPDGWVLVHAGSFQMGIPNDQTCGPGTATPVHEVTLTRSFYMQKTEVTQAEWTSLMGTSPFHFTSCGQDCPAENITWFDALSYCNKLSEKEGLESCYDLGGGGAVWTNGLDCKGYRLPTEAEWEYAAHAGTETAFYSGDITDCAPCSPAPDLDKIGWYCGNSVVTYGQCVDASAYGGPACTGTHPVAQKLPNAWGLFDTSGNVYEWCWDWYGETYYSVSPKEDPTGPANGEKRVLKGGSAPHSVSMSRPGTHIGYFPDVPTATDGFRPVRTVK